MTIDSLGLSQKAIQLATERPNSWKFRLFAQVIFDEVETVKRLFKKGHRVNSAPEKEVTTLSDISNWAREKSDEILVILNDLNSLVNSNHDDAFGIPGSPGNVNGIVEYSRKIVVFYYKALAWSQIVQNTSVAPQFKEVQKELDALPMGIAASIESFSIELLKQVNEAINPSSTSKPRTLTVTLEVIISTDRLKSAIDRLTKTSGYTINDIDLMTGYEFENFIAELFSKTGYETEVTKASGDQGIDVIVSKNGVKIGVQTKCYSGTVGNRAIQEAVAGKNFYRLDKAMVVTNSYFTESAQQLARANSIVLWDRNILKEKIYLAFHSEAS